MLKKHTKTIETIQFTVHVLQHDIDEGRCGLIAKCMHKIAIERELRKIDPQGGDHKVRCDGQLVKFNLDSYRHQALLPRSAKISLLIFDKERKARMRAEKKDEKFVSKIKPHSYRIEAERKGHVPQLTRERMEQIYEARRRRKQQGSPDRKYDVHHRIEGLGTV